MVHFICQNGKDHSQLPDGAAARLGITEPNGLHLCSQTIVAAALSAKQGGYIRLPFCNTLAAEALGASAKLTLSGALPEPPPFSSAAQIPDAPVLTPRMEAMLDAVELLATGGERVIFQVDGPLTLLGALLPMAKIYSALRKPEGAALLERAAAWSAEWAGMAAARGALILSYADPTATLDILGKRTFQRDYQGCCIRLLERLRQENPSILVHLCGKMTQSLLDTECCTLERWSAPSAGGNYGRVLEDYRLAPGEKQIVGHWCLNRLDAPRSELALIVWKKEMVSCPTESKNC